MACILAVNDDLVALKLLEAQLAKADHEVLVASGAMDAMSLLHKAEVHLVTTDVHMPGIDGWQFCKILKVEPNSRHLPVLFLSATEWTPIGQRLAARLGAAGFVSLPCKTEDLLDAVATVLRGETLLKEHKIRVMVAEDEVVVRQVLVRVLRDEGYEVEEALDGQECQEKILECPPHLLFLDHVMPRKKGLDILMWIQKQGLNIPVVMMTGAGSEMLAVEAMKGGAYDYLVKPLHMGEIPALCDDVLARHYSNMITREFRHRIKQMMEIESRLREAERLRVLVETAGAAAHEISQPLTGVLGWAEIMLNQETISREYLEKIRNEALRIRDILRRMSSVTRYATRPYVGDLSIVDFKEASDEPAEQVPSDSETIDKQQH